MFDRKSLANELLALRKSSLAIGNENQTLADAIERILTQLEGDGGAITPDESGHLAAAMTALKGNHPYLARSNILLALDSINRPGGPGGYQPTGITALRHKLHSLRAHAA